MTLLHFYIVLVGWFFRLIFRIRPQGSENIPDGAAILCSNHTSMLDPVFMILGMGRKAYRPTNIMGKKELEHVPVLSWLVKPFMVYVDRGKSDMAAIKETIARLSKGEKFVIFPEGTRIDAGEQSQAKTGVALMAIKSGAPIVPVYITAARKPMFSFKRIDVIYGEPYHPEKQAGVSTSEAYRIIADDMMDRIARLGKML